MDNALEAQRQGLETLGIADHGPANWGHIGTTALTEFDQIIAECRKVQAQFSGLKILAGTEANLIGYNGELDIPLEMQRKLDQVLAGFHLTIKPKDLRTGFQFASRWAMAKMSERGRQYARVENTKAMVATIYQNEIDIITHPGLGISIDTRELARACVKRNTALEINAKHGVKSIAFIQTAAKEGVKFAIGSDAHQPEKVGRLEAGLQAAKQAGLRADQLINVVDD